MTCGALLHRTSRCTTSVANVPPITGLGDHILESEASLALGLGSPLSILGRTKCLASLISNRPTRKYRTVGSSSGFACFQIMVNVSLMLGY